MKFRKIAPERWRSFDGRYEIWVHASKTSNPVKVYYGARVVATDDWLGVTFTYDEAITACRSYAAKQAGVARG